MQFFSFLLTFSILYHSLIEELNHKRVRFTCFTFLDLLLLLVLLLLFGLRIR